MEKEEIIQKILEKIPCNPIMLSMADKGGMSAEVKILDIKKGLEEAYEEGLKG